MSWALPQQRITDEQRVCSLLSLLRAEGSKENSDEVQREFVLEGNCPRTDIVCGAGGFCCCGSPGDLVHQMGFLLGNTEISCVLL